MFENCLSYCRHWHSTIDVNKLMVRSYPLSLVIDFWKLLITSYPLAVSYWLLKTAFHIIPIGSQLLTFKNCFSHHTHWQSVIDFWKLLFTSYTLAVSHWLLKTGYNIIPIGSQSLIFVYKTASHTVRRKCIFLLIWHRSCWAV